MTGELSGGRGGASFDDALFGPVLVNGAGSELGLAVACAIRARGGTVLGLCRREASVRLFGERGLAAVVVRTPEELPQLVAAGLPRAPAGYVDCMHSRREGLVASLAPQDISAWAEEDIALRARFLRSVVRLMLPGREGRCVFVSSSALASPAPGQGFYVAAKAAGEALYASVGLELAGRGITTCSVRFGWIESGRGRDYLEGRRDACAALVPTGRLVRLDEAAEAVVYLLSRRAAMINATTLTMDGGFSLCKPRADRGR